MSKGEIPKGEDAGWKLLMGKWIKGKGKGKGTERKGLRRSEVKPVMVNLDLTNAIS